MCCVGKRSSNCCPSHGLQSICESIQQRSTLAASTPSAIDIDIAIDLDCNGHQHENPNSQAENSAKAVGIPAWPAWGTAEFSVLCLRRSRGCEAEVKCEVGVVSDERYNGPSTR